MKSQHRHFNYAFSHKAITVLLFVSGGPKCGRWRRCWGEGNLLSSEMVGLHGFPQAMYARKQTTVCCMLRCTYGVEFVLFSTVVWRESVYTHALQFAPKERDFHPNVAWSNWMSPIWYLQTRIQHIHIIIPYSYEVTCFLESFGGVSSPPLHT